MNRTTIATSLTFNKRQHLAFYEIDPTLRSRSTKFKTLLSMSLADTLSIKPLPVDKTVIVYWIQTIELALLGVVFNFSKRDMVATGLTSG